MKVQLITTNLIAIVASLVKWQGSLKINKQPGHANAI